MTSRVVSIGRCVLFIAVVLCAATAGAQTADDVGPKPVRDPAAHLNLLIGTQAVLHSVDIFSTAYNLQLDDRAREGNPLLKPFAGRPIVLAAVSGGIGVLQAYTITKLRRNHPKLAVVWALALIGTEAYAVTNNVRVARELRRTRAAAR